MFHLSDLLIEISMWLSLGNYELLILQIIVESSATLHQDCALRNWPNYLQCWRCISVSHFSVCAFASKYIHLCLMKGHWVTTVICNSLCISASKNYTGQAEWYLDLISMTKHLSLADCIYAHWKRIQGFALCNRACQFCHVHFRITDTNLISQVLLWCVFE